MDWRTTYPSLATVNEASLETLITWHDMLPPPQTDVERTIRRRLHAQIEARTSAELRKVNPEIADKWDDLMTRLDAFDGLKDAVRSRL